MTAHEHIDGYFLHELPIGARLTVQTRNTTYYFEIRKGEVWIKGHHFYCPDWTKIDFHGSDGTPDWVGVGQHMEWFSNPAHGNITTSAVERITCHSNPKHSASSCTQPIPR